MNTLNKRSVWLPRAGLLVPMFVLVFVFLFVPAQATRAQPAPAAELTAEQAAQDMRVLRRAVLALHPGRLKYQSEAAWAENLARFEARAGASSTRTEMLLAVAEFTASLRCGHTWPNSFNQKGAVRAVLMEAANKLPFTLRPVQGRWLVMASADAQVRAGDEVLAINGVAGPDIAARVWPYLRADGSSDSKRWRQLGHDRNDSSQMDLVWPLLSPPASTAPGAAPAYRVSLRRQGTAGEQQVSVAATTLAARQAALQAQGAVPVSSDWSLRFEGTGAQAMAVMRLPSFAFYSGASRNFDWKAWLQRSFADVQARQVPVLVLDVRDLEGGDSRVGEALIAHLLAATWRMPAPERAEQAVSAYERVPYVLARYLDTWDYDFFDRTGQVERITSGPQAGLWLVSSRVRSERLLEPAAPRFTGRVFMLVGGENSSAGFMLAQMAQQAGAATLVGQATGGNQRGLNAGQLAFVTLPNSGVVVDMPLLAHPYTADTPDAPVLPELLVQRRLEAQRAGVDEEMAAVRQALGWAR
jgi:hypothetical protein